MSFAKRFNRKKFSIDTTGFDYASLCDCYNNYGADTVYTIRALYINTKGKYDDAPVVATDSFFVNIPSFLCEDCREMLADDSIIEDINNGKCGFKIYPYTSHEKECFGVEWVDI